MPGGRRKARAATLGRLGTQEGFGFVAVLLALVIAATLYFGYFTLPDVFNQRSTGRTAMDASRVVACRTNRQNIERAVLLWSVSHPREMPTLDVLADDGFRMPSCPEGGHYDLSGRAVRCTAHR